MRNKNFAIQRMLQGLIFHSISIIVSILFILPLFWMFVASLRQPGLPPPVTIEWLPRSPAWSNYVRIFQMLPFKTYLLNSLTVACAAVCITLLTGSLAGFAMAQLRWKWQRFFLVVSFSVGHSKYGCVVGAFFSRS
jgi:multiple sugar transport system permease protein